MPYQSFLAAALDKSNQPIDRVPVVVNLCGDNNHGMVVMTSDANVFITRQQAMDFFGLVEPIQPTAITPAGAVAVTWDVLYLESEDAIMVRHTQYAAITREDAIAAFRTELGTVPYIVSVREHATDMNDNDD